MYIFDPLYGSMHFSPLVYKCMLSTEVQRLREVRLCNINSLCITGSANTNRFEHSVGTAYLASINMEAEKENGLKISKKETETFIIAALLHDVANGPFGHSYEYIMQKKGFVPEKGLEDVFADPTSIGNGAHQFTSPFEAIYFGQLRRLNSLLSDDQMREITSIIAGNNALSKLISDSIDLDNIDNVFRMAYHMGISFRKEAPIVLAKSMVLKNGEVFFLKSATSYLKEWYYTRKKIYKLLLLNPQEFSGKYMLTEALDILFECIAQGKAQGHDIKWYYTDYQLMEEICQLNEVWLKRKMLLCKFSADNVFYDVLKQSDEDYQRQQIKRQVESLTLSVPIKEKGKSGFSDKIIISDNFSFSVTDKTIKIVNRNMEFEICDGNLYKIVNDCCNPSSIISRLMTGDLYHCVMIIETSDIKKYDRFLEYEERIVIEDELSYILKSKKTLANLDIGLHPILDLNKTERQLQIKMYNSNETITIGEESSKKLLIGVFVKNNPYGLKNVRESLGKKQDDLIKILLDFFSSYFNGVVTNVPLYEEADKYGY